jgi:hypothetical protein
MHSRVVVSSIIVAVVVGCGLAQSKPAPSTQTPATAPANGPLRGPTGRRLDPIYLAVAKLDGFDHAEPINQGTGCFYRAGGGSTIYLVTNRHVVDPRFGTPPVDRTLTALRTHLHVDRNDLTKNQDVEFPLVDKRGRALWHVDSKPIEPTKRAIDLAAVEIDQSINGLLVTVLSAADFAPKDLMIAAGEDVIIAGYPYTFHDSVHNLPVLRAGTVASSFGIPFEGLPMFLADANLHPGMSGGPVFTKLKNVVTWDEDGNTTFGGDVKIFFLGINSGSRNVSNAAGQLVAQLGLNDIWYAEEIEKLISSFATKKR